MNTRQTRHCSKTGAAATLEPSQEKKKEPSPENRIKEPEPGPAPKPKPPAKTGESSYSTRSPALVKVPADSSSSPTREMNVRDWTEFHIHEVRKLAVVFRDHIESIDNNCFRVDERKLDLNNNGSYTLALGLVQQIHSAVKNHVELLQELDTRMCEEFTSKYPKKPTFNFSKIELAVSSSTETEALMSSQLYNRLNNEDEDDDGDGVENGDPLANGIPENLPAPDLPAALPESDEDFYKSALLADSDDECRLGNLSLSRRSKRAALKQAQSGSELSDDESGKKKTRNSKKPLRRTSTSGGLSEYADALEDLEDHPTAPLPSIPEDKTEGQGDKKAEPERREEEAHASGTGKRPPGEGLEIIKVSEAKVLVPRLGKTILKELERKSFIIIGSSSTEDEDNQKMLAAIRKKIVLRSSDVTPKFSMAKVKVKKGTSKGKTEKSVPELLSDNESDDVDLEAIRQRKQELPQIRPKALADLLSVSSEEASDDEEEAKRMLLGGGEDEKKARSTEKKLKKTDKEESSKPRPKTPYTGPTIRLSDSDSEDSDCKSKGQRSLRSRASKRSPAKKVNEVGSESSDTEPIPRNKKSKSQDAKEEKRSSPSKTGRVPCSESDSEEDSKRKLLKDQKPNKEANSGSGKAESDSRKKSGTIVVSIAEDSDSDSPKRVTRNGHVKERKEFKHAESDNDNSDDSDFIPTKKAKVIKKNKSGSDSDIQEISVHSEDGSESGDGKMKKKQSKSKGSGSDTSTSAKQKKKKKRLRRIKRNSSSEEEKSDQKGNESESGEEDQNDESQGSAKGRKNIRKLMKVKDLKVSTKEAAKQEEARKLRLSERQKLYNEIFKPPESDKLDSLVLDFNKVTKEALVSVDSHIVSQLKPHQATGIQFMWNACFETLDSKKEGGCILAHCMGLGKTLQSVAFVHTLVNHKQTGVRTVLIICPLNTVENWYTEFRKWTRNADGRINLHRLWEEKGNDRYKSLQAWHKHGGAGILHYEGFRALINSDQKKGKLRLQSRFLDIIKETLVDPGPNLVICDEGHLLKNASSQISKAVNRIKTKRRIVLTGTPLQNNLNEYHTMMSFVKPSLLGDIKEFRNRFVNPILNGQHKDSQPHDVVLMKKRAHVLHKLLEGCVQRLDYTVLTPFLPPKFEYAIIVNLTDKQKDLYDYYMKNLSNQGREGFSSTKLFSDYTVLNKICTHPIALTYKSRAQMDREESDEEGSLKDFICDDGTTSTEETSSPSGSDTDASTKQKKSKSAKKKVKTRSAAKDDDDELTVVEQPNDGKNSATWYKQFFDNDEEMRKIELSGKLRVLVEILRVAESVGDKVLIFSQYLTTLDLIEEFLSELDEEAQNAAKANATDELLNLSGGRSSEGRYRPQIDYFRIDGNTKTSSRQDQCDKFNQNLNKAKLFLISIRAGGLGINLYGANRVVIFDASWNPSQDLQAIFRVYRFGQSKPSYIYRLLARGTMEEKIYNRQVVKLSLSCRVVDEQQIERHYHYDDLQKMYHFDRDDPTERPTPIVPKDKLLAGLLQTHKDWVFSYLEHDSLLENKQEEELSEDAKKLAWDEFNNEGTRMANQNNFALLDFKHVYESNPAAFGLGTKDWSLYTMQRLHDIHPTAPMSSLVITVRDISTILRNLILKYPVMIGYVLGASMQERAEAINYCTEYIDKLRKTYKGTLNKGDIMYLGAGSTPMTQELANALLPPRIARPYPGVAAANTNMQQVVANFVANRQRLPSPGASFVAQLPAQSTFAAAFLNGNTPMSQGPRSSVASIPRPYVPPGPVQVVEIDE